MTKLLFLAFVGLCAGGVVAAGIVGLSIGLAILPRYAGITHTGDKVLWYENASMLGAVTGTAVYLFEWQIPGGSFGLFLYGLFAGIYLGGWILALAEMADIFPILARRIKLRMGLPFVIASIAFGKAFGSLWYFYKGW